MNIGGNIYENPALMEGYNGIEELKKLEDKEKRIIVEVIPFRTFREKIAITKQFYGKAKMEIFKDFVYIERQKG